MSARFGPALVRAMQESGWDAARLAQELGIIPRTVERWMMGESVPLEGMRYVALKKLGVRDIIAWYESQSDAFHRRGERLMIQGIVETKVRERLQAAVQHLRSLQVKERPHGEQWRHWGDAADEVESFLKLSPVYCKP